jgi:toxin YoeB
MKLAFTPRGWDDYAYWKNTDRATLKRLNKLLADMARTPTEGIGKPEPLKYRLGNVWSRRITEEHRLVYLVEAEELTVLQARFHYDT